MNWKQVAEATAVSASTLSRMTQDKRPDASSLAALAAWAGLNPAEFITNMEPATSPEPLAVISQQLRRDPNLTGEGAAALDELIKAAYRRFSKKKRNRQSP